MILRLIPLLVILLSSLSASAQNAIPEDLPAEASASPRIVERGPHHRVVRTVTRRVTPFGREYFVTNAYTELRTGMHYSDNGEWKESSSAIEVFPGGAIARGGAHQVIWSPNLNVQGAVDMLTPDGKRFRSHILGLAYTDAVSGQSVLIAEPKDCIGEVVGNQVIYRDAFTGPFRADVRYTFTAAGMSQDILIREVLPSPGEYDLSDERSRIEVWTEFIEAAEPTKERSVIKVEENLQLRRAMIDPDMTDETLDFGAMRIGTGSAFPLDTPADDEFNSESAPVGKNWIQLEGRTFLIEKTDLRDIREKINRLPKSTSINGSRSRGQAAIRKGSSRRTLLAALPVPERREARGGNGTMRTALVMPPEKGFVLDYSMVSTATNFTFKSDTTYFISGNVTLSGTTIVESAVIKYTNGNSTARLIVQGPVICRTDSHRPVIFTAMDDDTVGEIIAGSTGHPTNSLRYGYFLDIAGNTNVIDLHNVRMRRGYYGVNMNSSSKLVLRDAQISSNYAGVVISSGEARLRNVLMHDCRYAYGGASTNNHAEHATFHRMEFLRSGTSVSSYNTFLTNSMVISVTNFIIYTGVNIASNASDSGIFQTVGQGQRYLANGSTNRNAGTTNINPGLLDGLKARTTYPPIVLANLNASTNLSPVVERDTSLPDLGYHYDVLDFLVGGVAMTNVTLTVTNGATVGLDSSQTNYGIRLGSGAAIHSEGSPTNFNRFVRSLLVQEVPAGNSSVLTPLFADTVPIPANATTFKARFTDFPASPNSYLFNQSWGNGTLINLHLRDSYVKGGRITLFPSSSNCVVTLTNCLLDRVNLFIYEYAQQKFHAFNNLFRGGTNYLEMRINSVWDWRNNLFDQTLLQQWIYGTFNHSHNGYVNGHSRLTPTNASDMVLTASPAYDTNAYGLYYLPSGSSLINAGSTNASVLGLYHYTTATNQVKETNSTVDIGLHYVALNPSGTAVDSDGDSLGDYHEDLDGDGVTDATESSYLDFDTDYDGRNDGQEYGDGTSSLDATSVMAVLLGRWRFDTNSWAGDQGQLPKSSTNLTMVASWNTNSVVVSSNPVARLNYRDVEPSTTANISCKSGTVRFWFRPEWVSTNRGGVGPGGFAVLLSLGGFTNTASYGFWAMAIGSSGTNLQLITQDAGVSSTNLTAGVSWGSNEWRQVALTYSPSNSSLYLDGSPVVTNGLGVQRFPVATVRSADGFSVGSNRIGTEQAKGAFEQLETYNYPLGAAAILSDYQQITDGDRDGDGIPDAYDGNPNSSGVGPSVSIDRPRNGQMIR